jgi:hypothetical protein
MRAIGRVADDVIKSIRLGETELDIGLDGEVVDRATACIDEATKIFEELRERNRRAIELKDARLLCDLDPGT